MPLQKRRDEFFKVMVHTLYRTAAVYNGCKKSVRMKLKIHRASNEESDVLSVYKRQQWGYRPKLSAKWILSILSDFTSHQRKWDKLSVYFSIFEWWNWPKHQFCANFPSCLKYEAVLLVHRWWLKGKTKRCRWNPTTNTYKVLQKE